MDDLTPRDEAEPEDRDRLMDDLVRKQFELTIYRRAHELNVLMSLYNSIYGNDGEGDGTISELGMAPQ